MGYQLDHIPKKSNPQPAILMISGSDTNNIRLLTSADLNGVSASAGTVTLSTVQATGGSVQLAAANSSRKYVEIVNNISSGANLYVTYNSPATKSGFAFVVSPSGTYRSENNSWSGTYFGIWDFQTPFANVGSGLIRQFS